MIYYRIERKQAQTTQQNQQQTQMIYYRIERSQVLTRLRGSPLPRWSTIELKVMLWNVDADDASSALWWSTIELKVALSMCLHLFALNTRWSTIELKVTYTSAASTKTDTMGMIYYRIESDRNWAMPMLCAICGMIYYRIERSQDFGFSSLFLWVLMIYYRIESLNILQS